MKKLVFVAASLAAIIACDDTGGSNCDTAGNCTGNDDTAEDTNGGDPTLIMSVDHDCQTDMEHTWGSNWVYTVETNGPTSDGLLDVTQDTAQALLEHHDLTYTADSSAFGGEVLQVTLHGSDVAGADNVIPNETTLFECDAHETGMIWRATIYDPTNTSQALDCVVWSGSATDPSEVYGSDYGGCSNANDWN